MSRYFLLLLFTLLCLSCDALTGEYTGADKQDVAASEQGESSQISEQKEFKLGGLLAKRLTGGKNILDGVAKNGGDAGHAFELKLQMQEGQSLTFTFFGSKDLEGGVDITFQVTDAVLEMTILHNEISHTHKLKDVDPSSIDLVVDVHNDHADTHILIWKKNTIYNDYEYCTFDGGCLYNSEDFAFDVWVGVGKASGVNWGLQIDDSDEESIIQLKGPLNANSNA